MNFWKKSTWNPKSPTDDESTPISLVKVTKIKKRSIAYPDMLSTSVTDKQDDINDDSLHDISCLHDRSRKYSGAGPTKKLSLVRFSSIRRSKKSPKHSTKCLVEPEITPAFNKPSIRYRKKRCHSNEVLMDGVSLRNDLDLENHRTRAAVSVYILDHLMTAKRIEMMENMYGGKSKSQKAAKIIQQAYRRHLVRKSTVISFGLKNKIRPKTNSMYDEYGRRKSRIWIDNSCTKATKVDYDPNDPFDVENNEERKRLFALGVNLFNRSCNKGIDFLIENHILENDSSSICKFFETKGLSNYSKGDFLSQDSEGLALESRRFIIANMSFHNCSIEKSIRQLFSFLRIPGETQKILNILNDFSEVYLTHNPEFEKQLKTPDTVVLLSFTILMLHTSLFNPSAKKSDRLTQQQFVQYFKHLNDEEFIDEAYLLEIYENIRRKQMKPLSDHTDLVRNVTSHLIGPLVPKDLVQNHRKFVCQFNVTEVMSITKKTKSGQHQRELFLFNDLLMITKKIQNVNYQVRIILPLDQLEINKFSTEYYPYGLELRRNDQPKFLLYLNCSDGDNRVKLIKDITMHIDEVCQLVLLKQQKSKGQTI